MHSNKKENLEEKINRLTSLYNDLKNKYIQKDFEKEKITLNNDFFLDFIKFIEPIKRCKVVGIITKTDHHNKIIAMDHAQTRTLRPSDSGLDALSQINAWLAGELKNPLMNRNLCHIKSIPFNIEYGITNEEKKVLYLLHKIQAYKQEFFIYEL